MDYSRNPRSAPTVRANPDPIENTAEWFLSPHAPSSGRDTPFWRWYSGFGQPAPDIVAPINEQAVMQILMGQYPTKTSLGKAGEVTQKEEYPFDVEQMTRDWVLGVNAEMVRQWPTR